MNKIKLFSVKKCNLCHSSPKSWKYLFPLNLKQKLVQCQECFLIFNDYQRRDFNNLYSSTYYQANETVKSGGGFFNYLSLESSFQKLYRFASDFIIQKSHPHQKYKILDIGCSYGFFLKQFKNDKRFDLSGVELNPQAIAYAKKNSHHIYPIPFEDFPITHQYDFVTAFELIEHLTDPFSTFRKVYNILKPGGFFLVATPNINSQNPLLKIFQNKWPSIHPDVHNYYFSFPTINQMAHKTGFITIHQEMSHFFYSDFFHFRKRLSEVFPIFRYILKLFSFIDRAIVPIPSGGDLRIIFQKPFS